MLRTRDKDVEITYVNKSGVEAMREGSEFAWLRPSDYPGRSVIVGDDNRARTVCMDCGSPVIVDSTWLFGRNGEVKLLRRVAKVSGHGREATLERMPWLCERHWEERARKTVEPREQPATKEPTPVWTAPTSKGFVSSAGVTPGIAWDGMSNQHKRLIQRELFAKIATKYFKETMVSKWVKG